MSLTLAAQKSEPVHLHFTPLYQGKALVPYEDGEPTSSSYIETFKCYLSAFKLIADGKVVWEETDSYHLLDASDPKTLEVHLTVPLRMAWDHVEFLLGIDSLTSVSGALGGDLDPTKGMYWEWNSGYICMKLEGHSPSSAGPNGGFLFHLGGYLPPFAFFRTIDLAMFSAGEQNITIDLDAFLSAIDLRTRYNVMSPGEAAHELGGTAATIFRCDNAK
ncbi:MAG: hypothetical protein IPO60_03925 [Flavobacteriales bacterium]|jgi:hypothetical protein|nr:hypothetical protein [Flavobacteriales bacterium]MBK6892311.1 hypothetical protein [Flavobacteriales bacterium]MBK7246446.1 hypothetical protein [Flavobacteriales bacterium]MBK9060619.1 hypothetical protein [Flavobacteriales bacterium]MBK9597484.1 hypothetical protein [Flavobacteriales bacterium]